MGHEATRWVLVAGTGQFELPPAVNWTARAAGRALARAGYGLVVGGWQGVDYVAAESFQAELLSAGKAVSSYLTQVVPNGSAPDFEGGYVVSVKPGPQEWVQGVKYADAVVLIGGVGATYTTYLFATQESRPVFPIAGTGNDARLAFTNILAHWNALPMEGVSKEVFASALGRGISSEQDAERVVTDLMSLLGRRFSLVSPHSQSERRLVFISGARQESCHLNHNSSRLF
jgi:predicted Rossmann-fold nucleotide-binding protein